MRIKKHVPSGEIPTSSMADIAFLLIVYFMITASFAATRGLDFALPEEDDAPPIIGKEDSVLIEIQPDGQLIVDQKPLPLDKIFEYLEERLEANYKKPVIIRPQPNAPYGHMVEVFDRLRTIKLRKPEGATTYDAYLVTLKEIQEAEEDEEIDLGKDVNVSIPTQREIDAFWF